MCVWGGGSILLNHCVCVCVCLGGGGGGRRLFYHIIVGGEGGLLDHEKL